MFNGECAQRNGKVVGACMDGFLFGTCCQLPGNINPIQETILPDSILNQENTIALKEEETQPAINNDIISNEPTLLQTTNDNDVVQVESVSFYPVRPPTPTDSAETVLYHSNGSEVNNIITSQDFYKDKSTSRVEASTKPFYYHSSPIGLTTKSNYVRIPTITKPQNGTPEIDSIANILQMLDDKAPSKIVDKVDKAETKSPTTPMSVTPTNYAPNTIYLFTSTPGQYTVSNTPKLPSTSYVFSSTLSPRPGKPESTTRPQTTLNTSPQYVSTPQYSSTPQYVPTPQFQSLSPQYSSSSQYAPSSPSPLYNQQTSQYTTSIPSPTVILLGPVGSSTPKPYVSPESSLSPTVLITPKPNLSSTGWTKPTAIRYPTTYPTDTSNIIVTGSSTGSASSNVPSSDDLTNFPPVRNPNLNMSQMSTTPDEDSFDITTPVFLEDDELNDKVELFVNKIIQSLQEPFDDLRTVVYSNKTSNPAPSPTTKKPPKKTSVTTKKPPLKASTITTKKPTTLKKPTKKITPPTTTTTKRPVTILTTRRTKPTKRITTTTPVSSSSEESSSSSEEDDDDEEEVQQIPDYRRRKFVVLVSG